MQIVDLVLPADTHQSVDVVLDAIATLASPTVIVDVVLEGPPGPPGADGATGSAVVFDQSTPASSVAIAHPFNRLPAVAVYIAGEQIETDVSVDTSNAYLSFPAPTVFTAVLT